MSGLCDNERRIADPMWQINDNGVRRESEIPANRIETKQKFLSQSTKRHNARVVFQTPVAAMQQPTG
jgi:hypothetical protein